MTDDTTAQHTPGPWRADGLNILASYDTDDGNRHHCHVADVTNRNAINRAPSMEECANAALIASAPTLKAENELYRKTNETFYQALRDIAAISAGGPHVGAKEAAAAAFDALDRARVIAQAAMDKAQNGGS